MNRPHALPVRWLRGRDGAAAAEFALLLPLLCVLLFGFFEVGRLVWDYHIVAASVRDAARYAARFDASCTGGGSYGGDLTRVRKLARTGSVDGTTPLIAGWTNDASVTVTVSCVDNTGATWSGRYKDMTAFPTVTVTATAPHQSLVPAFLPGLAVTSVTVSDQQAWTQ